MKRVHSNICYKTVSIFAAAMNAIQMIEYVLLRNPGYKKQQIEKKYNGMCSQQNSSSKTFIVHMRSSNRVFVAVYDIASIIWNLELYLVDPVQARNLPFDYLNY